jgi:hypothetical protein
VAYEESQRDHEQDRAARVAQMKAATADFIAFAAAGLRSLLRHGG